MAKGMPKGGGRAKAATKTAKKQRTKTKDAYTPKSFDKTGLRPTKKSIARDGSTFSQTFWVDAKGKQVAPSRGGKAKPDSEKNSTQIDTGVKPTVASASINISPDGSTAHVTGVEGIKDYKGLYSSLIAKWNKDPNVSATELTRRIDHIRKLNSAVRIVDLPTKSRNELNGFVGGLSALQDIKKSGRRVLGSQSAREVVTDLASSIHQLSGTDKFDTVVSQLLNNNVELPPEVIQNYLYGKLQGSKQLNPDSVREQVESKAQEIKGLPHEQFNVIGHNGSNVLEKSGSVNQVSFSQSELFRMQGGVGLHNHPSGSGGHSVEDIVFGAGGQLSENVVTMASGRTYSLKPPEGHDRFSEEWLSQHTESLRNTYIKHLVEGRGAVKTSNDRAASAMLAQNLEARGEFEAARKITESSSKRYLEEMQQHHDAFLKEFALASGAKLKITNIDSKETVYDNAEELKAAGHSSEKSSESYKKIKEDRSKSKQAYDAAVEKARKSGSKGDLATLTAASTYKTSGLGASYNGASSTPSSLGLHPSLGIDLSPSNVTVSFSSDPARASDATTAPSTTAEGKAPRVIKTDKKTGEPILLINKDITDITDAEGNPVTREVADKFIYDVQNGKKTRRIPHDWENVILNTKMDEDNTWIAKGTGGDGEEKFLDSDSEVARKEDQREENRGVRFLRVSEISKRMPDIGKELDAEVEGGSHEALVTRIMSLTGMRVGDEGGMTGVAVKDRATGKIKKDSKGKTVKRNVKTYGTTTLLRRHVSITTENGKEVVKFDFVGKKAGRNKSTVSNPTVVAAMKKLMDASPDPDGKIFNTNQNKVNAYIAASAKKGGAIPASTTAKDFRTNIGTSTADAAVVRHIAKHGRNIHKDQLDELKRRVGLESGKMLSHQDAIEPWHSGSTALKNYIDPSVFDVLNVTEDGPLLTNFAPVKKPRKPKVKK